MNMKVLMTVASLCLASLVGTQAIAAQEGELDSEPEMEESLVEEVDDAIKQDAEPADEDLGSEDGPVVLMSARWADLACDAWNSNETLTRELAAPGWAANHQGRGMKVLQLYRTDCEDSGWVELQITDEEGQARCTFGGAAVTEELVKGADYIMHARTSRWLEMGAGDYGPMKGMMTGRLKFKGPKWEAMKNMGPFSSFLRLVGEVEADASACPEVEDG